MGGIVLASSSALTGAAAAMPRQAQLTKRTRYNTCFARLFAGVQREKGLLECADLAKDGSLPLATESQESRRVFAFVLSKAGVSQPQKSLLHRSTCSADHMGLITHRPAPASKNIGKKNFVNVSIASPASTLQPAKHELGQLLNLQMMHERCIPQTSLSITTPPSTHT